MKKCITCEKPFLSKREGQLACSRSCNAKHHNKELAKRFVCPLCPICGNKTRPESRAKYCSLTCQGKGRQGKNHPLWKGGIKKHGEGYVYEHNPKHKYADGNGYVLQHRLVMEKSLGRYLKPKEIVHHINGKKSDNRIENLILLKDQAEHLAVHGFLLKFRKIR